MQVPVHFLHFEDRAASRRKVDRPQVGQHPPSHEKVAVPCQCAGVDQRPIQIHVAAQRAAVQINAEKRSPLNRRPVLYPRPLFDAVRDDLVGMQPQLKRVPPARSFSTQATFLPSCAARIAPT